MGALGPKADCWPNGRCNPESSDGEGGGATHHYSWCCAKQSSSWVDGEWAVVEGHSGSPWATGHQPAGESLAESGTKCSEYGESWNPLGPMASEEHGQETYTPC